MKLNVYAIPDNVADKELKDKTVVLIDLLRATSTMLTALANGCKEVIPAAEIEEVINMSKNYEKDSYLLCGERNVQAIDGFHLSNSPLEYTSDKVSGKTLLMTTTNGTQAFKRVTDAAEVIICSLVNVDAVAEYLAEQQNDLVFICAGTGGQFSTDDVVTAGAVVHRLTDKLENLELSDLAVVARTLYQSSANELYSLLKNSAHYKKLADAGMKKDIEYCLTLNAAPVLGVYKDGVVKLADEAKS
ncbi:MAG TPA: 2-phosphosulfolactate phosphatase [Clostridiales bacterium]|jgi:2-phosphosulfolactate phosphatase|nr:2-phosphosulfolactate phosphatase [Clostridia bacterium]HCS73228.1 2-phosphosulfolactate phosphatase [Clostridiales bacterium]